MSEEWTQAIEMDQRYFREELASSGIIWNLLASWDGTLAFASLSCVAEYAVAQVRTWPTSERVFWQLVKDFFLSHPDCPVDADIETEIAVSLLRLGEELDVHTKTLVSWSYIRHNYPQITVYTALGQHLLKSASKREADDIIEAAHRAVEIAALGRYPDLLKKS